MLAQALPTGQLWLCFPREENCTNLDPLRVQNRAAGGPGGGRLFCASWAQLGRQGRSEALFGRLWGRSWDAVGALEAVLGPSGPLGRSWAPLGGLFWPSRGLLWTIWTMSVALREMQQKPFILQCFWASRACRRGPKTLQNWPGNLLDVSGDQRPVWRAQVEVHKGQVELHKAVLDPM